MPTYRDASPDSLKFAVMTLFDKRGEALGNLCDRWQDEREYEDFKDYVAVIRKWFDSTEFSVIAVTKRPFGVEFTATRDGVTYAYSMTASAGSGTVQWRRIR